MANVTGVPVVAVEQSAIQHDAATHAGRHHHGQVVVDAAGRAQPALAQGQRLGVVVHRHRQAQMAVPGGHGAGSRARPGC